jgi:hypothetical protein
LNKNLHFQQRIKASATAIPVRANPSTAFPKVLFEVLAAMLAKLYECPEV